MVSFRGSSPGFLSPQEVGVEAFGVFAEEETGTGRFCL